MRNPPKPGTLVADLDTPALLVDLDVLQANLACMAAFFSDKPASLRPHAKTHKCPQIARMQLAAGAIGITCAKVSEAEVMAEAGAGDILIANQVVGASKVDRVAALAERCNLMVAVDDAVNVGELAAACAARRVHLRVLVEVDIGMRRCGVQPGLAALELAREVADAPYLELAGLMGYEGHLVLVKDMAERAAAVRAAIALLDQTRNLLDDSGLPVGIVSGGSTSTYAITGTTAPITEVQAGSYVFMDATYRPLRPEFTPALTVLATVVSRPAPDRVVADAGLKAMTTELGRPQLLDLVGVTVRHLSEEHGVLGLEMPEAVKLRPGDKLRFLPSHCCTTTNLYDWLHVIQDGRLVDLWPVAARGCAQ